MKSMQEYDFLIIGSGLTGSVLAYELKKAKKSVLVIDQRSHIGGNCYTENINNIEIHKYGAHIFHTNKKEIWEYINQFSDFNSYINQPIAMYKNKIYSLPFNMNLFYELFKTKTPQEAIDKIEIEKYIYKKENPKNLEDQAINLVGKTIYETIIKGYTEKQWGKSCKELSPEIIKRIPLRFTYNNNYFDDDFQGIPKKGYTKIFKKLLKNIQTILNIKYENIKNEIQAKKIIHTGMIDDYYDYCFGELEYRSLSLTTVKKNTDNFQGNAVVNYTEFNIPFTRIIEHIHFTPDIKTEGTIISYEYPESYTKGKIPYYPINNQKNNTIHKKYLKLAEKDNIIFTGRLGQYKYINMDQAIEGALKLSKKLI